MDGLVGDGMLTGSVVRFGEASRGGGGESVLPIMLLRLDRRVLFWFGVCMAADVYLNVLGPTRDMFSPAGTGRVVDVVPVISAVKSARTQCGLVMRLLRTGAKTPGSMVRPAGAVTTVDGRPVARDPVRLYVRLGKQAQKRVH